MNLKLIKTDLNRESINYKYLRIIYRIDIKYELI